MESGQVVPCVSASLSPSSSSSSGARRSSLSGLPSVLAGGTGQDPQTSSRMDVCGSGRLSGVNLARGTTYFVGACAAWERRGECKAGGMTFPRVSKGNGRPLELEVRAYFMVKCVCLCKAGCQTCPHLSHAKVWSCWTVST